jgi:hypothetical protein
LVAASSNCYQVRESFPDDGIDAVADMSLFERLEFVGEDGILDPAVVEFLNES